MRAARAGPVLRGQHFAKEQILRGPALAALSGLRASLGLFVGM